MRNSRQRQAILKVIKGTHTHPDAVWVYEQTRKEISNISLGTVYRNLKCLKEEGEILEILVGNQSKYDGDTYNHSHFKCDRCHEIYDLEFTLDDKVNREIAKSTGFEVAGNYLEFRGICRRCIQTPA